MRGQCNCPGDPATDQGHNLPAGKCGQHGLHEHLEQEFSTGVGVARVLQSVRSAGSEPLQPVQRRSLGSSMRFGRSGFQQRFPGNIIGR